jgi:RNA polymerase sigma factor (sigma-70 family)
MDAATTGCDGVLSAEVQHLSAGKPIGLLTSHFERFYRRVYGYLLHRLFDQELAEELTAEAFYRAAAHHRRLYGNERQIEVWLLRTAARLADTHYRRMRLHRLLLGRFAQTRSASVSEDPPGEDELQGSQARVREVLRKLPLRHQSVIVMRYYMEMSIDEMAAVHQCRPETIRVRLSRAIKEIRRRLRV